MAGVYLLMESLLHRNSTCLYITKTRAMAKQIMYKDVFGMINDKFRLGLKFNRTTLTVTCPNGSLIYLLGMDSKEEEKDKALGQKYRLVVCDEAGSFHRDLEEIIKSVLMPACVDLKGTIMMCGTPQSDTSTFFHDVSNGATLDPPFPHPEWQLFSWSGYDNPFIKEVWTAEINRLLAQNALVKSTAWFKQNYLGEWDVDPADKVYKYDSDKNTVKDGPVTFANKLEAKDYIYALGVDIGFVDPMAFVLIAYNEHDPTVYIVEAFKMSYMELEDVAVKIRDYQKRYKALGLIIADTNSPREMEHLRSKYGIPYIRAEKLGRLAQISLINDDFVMGKIKVKEDQCVPLVEELRKYVYKDRKKHTFSDTADDHCCDAMRYVITGVRHYFTTPEPQPIVFGSKEYSDDLQKRIADRIEREKGERDYWDEQTDYTRGRTIGDY